MPHAFLTRRKSQAVVPVWDYHALLASLGSAPGIARRIRALGYDPPSPKTINGWSYRGRVPSQWTPLLIQWALKERKLDSVDQLLIKDQIPL